MKLLTSFTQLTTGEGDRIAYTYSEVDDTGNIVNQNIKGGFIVLDDELADSLAKIKEYIKSKKLQ